MSGSCQATEGTTYRVWIASLVILRRLWDEIGEPEVALDELTTFLLKLDQRGHCPSKTVLSWEFFTSLAKLLSKVKYRSQEISSVKSLLDQDKYVAKSESLVLLRNLTRLPSYPEPSSVPEAVLDSLSVEKFVKPEVTGLDEDNEYDTMDEFNELKSFLRDLNSKKEMMLVKTEGETRREKLINVFEAIENLSKILQ